ncbi:hypothetical protein MCOR25_001826 [Pyricularia grisea]|uniref:Oxidoreductase-like protein n=1 Tax=Pyricularia grisea TaxID=148305 RepID=A0A6P8B7Q6_PYRGI|nr:hypothetical protein PgNI_05288 [Pyricularia grisea]KAI6380175.1 hypothetical protein MCOR25_001826 [Pyricularia grisea]TLD11310.1 hypothetical protein PgNI_05288 [Pyricularia grisea]
MCVTYPYYQPERDIPSLRGKVVLITGGTIGLGKEAAAQLSQNGRPAQVWIAGRNAERAGATIAEIRRRLRKKPGPMPTAQPAPPSSSGSLSRSSSGSTASVETTRSQARATGTNVEQSGLQLGTSSLLEMSSLRPNRSHIDLGSRSLRTDKIGRSLPGSVSGSTTGSNLGEDDGRGGSSSSSSSKQADETEVYFLYMDLANLDSVKDAASRFLACVDRLDILILNAAEVSVPSGVTAQGYERHFGTNHLGHALLIKLLMRLLVRTATCDSIGSDVRVICVSSFAHRFTPPEGIDFDSLKPDPSLFADSGTGAGSTPNTRQSDTNHTNQDGRDGGNGKAATSGSQRPQRPVSTLRRRRSSNSGNSPSTRLLYGQSKLANILYARELAERCPLFTTVSIHPGIARSKGNRRRGGSRVVGSGAVLERFEQWFVPVFGASLDEGAKNHLWAATGRGIRNGQYYEPVGVPARPSGVGEDRVLSWKLWEWTQRELAGYSL